MYFLNLGNGTMSSPSTPVMPPVTPAVMPVITPSAKLPMQTLPNKSKPVSQQQPLTKIATTPQKVMVPQKPVAQSKIVTSPPPQKIMTPSKLMTSQKPASTSKVTPTATPATKTLKPSMNGSSALQPVTLTKNKSDLIVMEKMTTNCSSYATVKDNGSKK